MDQYELIITHRDGTRDRLIIWAKNIFDARAVALQYWGYPEHWRQLEIIEFPDPKSKEV